MMRQELAALHWLWTALTQPQPPELAALPDPQAHAAAPVDLSPQRYVRYAALGHAAARNGSASRGKPRGEIR